MLGKKLIFPLCLIMAFLLLFSACQGSGKGSTAGGQTTTSATASTGESTTKEESAAKETGYTLPLSTDGATISICTKECSHPTKSLADILSIYKRYEQETGVKIEWEVIKPDYDVGMNTRLAAGTNLPDIITVPGDKNVDGYAKFIDAGLFLPLNDLIDQYAPNIKKFFELRHDIRKMLTYEDGNIYVLPNTVYGLEPYKNSNDYVNPFTFMIRADLLQKANLPLPETIEDVYNALKAFKEFPDIIPYTMNGNTLANLRYFAHAYGIYASVDFYPDSNGKVIYQWTRPEVKEWLIEMNKWYNEGLIDKEPNSQSYRPKVTGGKAGSVHANAANTYVWHPSLQQVVPDGVWTVTLPLKGPHGDQLTHNSGDYGSTSAVIKGTKNPELVIKWLDYCMFSERAMMDKMWGEPDVDYVIENGKPKFTQHYQDETAKDGSYVYGTGAAFGGLPMIYVKEWRYEQAAGAYDNLPGGKEVLERTKKTAEMAYPAFPKMIPTGEETQIYNQYMSDINTYKEEMIEKFIRGIEPLDNFDNFVKAIQAMGIAEVEKVKQAQYDRFNK